MRFSLPIAAFAVTFALHGLFASASAAGLGLSPAEFRERYNAAAEKLNALSMPEELSESVAVPDKANKAKVLGTVRIYYLNERTNLLLNCLTESPDVVSGAAVMGGSGGDYTLAAATDMQAAMRALVTALTPKLPDEARNRLLGALGFEGSEGGDFTDGKVRSQTVDGLLFYTAASEADGVELVVRPAKKE